MLKAHVKWLAVISGLLLFLQFTAVLNAQSIFGTITGTVNDPSGSSVPNANVTLKNDASGDVRRTVSNSDGYYTFSSVPSGTYSLTIEAAGFQGVKQTNISLETSQKLNFNSTLQVGSATAEISVVSEQDALVPVDSGEKSVTLGTKQLQDFSVVGRSAAEFIKILPGFAPIGTGVRNAPGYDGQVMGINGNGEGGKQSAIGNYSANGLGSNAIDITADGAHVSDPGCNCASPVNPNTDMIAEFKAQTSNFSAENSKGPVVLNSVAKSGGQQFHGEGYFYARDYSLNAQDWQNNELGLAKPANRYFFPGAQIGGPVLIPKTRFNHDRNKLFFFTAYEYYYQSLDTGILKANVPTDANRAGNFAGGPQLVNPLGTADAAGNLPPLPGNIIPASLQDPNGKALLNLYPKANTNPASNAGGYNYIDQVGLNQNSYQWLSRVDYSISDNTKLFVRYNLQNELQTFPVGLWWRAGSNPVPYPTPIDAHNTSSSISASLTHVFTPTLTNEVVFGYTYINFPNSLQDKNAVDRTKLGLNFTGIYNNGVAQVPALLSYSGGIATLHNPGGFEAGNGTLFATKYLPSVSDNITKVWGTHTLKGGFYWEHIINNQPSNNYSNGLIQYANYLSGTGSGNNYADLLLGAVQNYQETNKNILHNEAFTTTEFFAQDSWKATRRLTLEYGVRFAHLGNWTDRGGIGFSVWDPTTYTNAPASPTDYVGLQWHARNSKVPLSGFAQKALFTSPRFGVAYDVFGTGKTVVRGGWGQYRYHTPQFTTGYDYGYGVLSFTTPTPFVTFAQIQQLKPQYSGRQSVQTLDPKEGQQPLTRSYTFTISQRLPDASLLEVSYVGSSSLYQPDSNGTYNNVNAVPYGTLLGVNTSATGFNYDAYRPLANYQDLQVARNNLYSNYNGAQITYARQKGRYNYQFNYTYSKALGIAGNTDALNLGNNYGTLAFDRRHIFNAAYSIELPNLVKEGALKKGVANGWQLSGITQITSGIPLALNSNNQNFNVQGLQADNFYTGTNSVKAMPVLTCDPTSGLTNHQYINPNCFSAPTPGHNGPAVLPEIFGPAYFTSDLSLFKNLLFGESKRLQLRFSAYNFLNHPLYSFINNTDPSLTLQLANGKNSNAQFGTTTEKVGRRTIQLAIKFYF